jgi:hypothetical protein
LSWWTPLTSDDAANTCNQTQRVTGARKIVCLS